MKATLTRLLKRTLLLMLISLWAPGTRMLGVMHLSYEGYQGQLLTIDQQRNSYLRYNKAKGLWIIA